MNKNASTRPVERPARGGRVAIYRHPLAVRLTHWTNALAILVLLMSGLQILNAHPMLYWGEVSTFASPAAEIGAQRDAEGTLRGFVRAGGLEVETTGVFGVSRHEGATEVRAIPRWLTLPARYDLGAARTWHFFFAWVFVASGLAYVAYGLASGRTRRMMAPSLAELRGIGRSLWDHLRLRFEHGEAARRYNVLQKLAYLAVMYVLLPLMVWTGLAMAPSVDARFPILSELFGGRQSARTVHFISAMGIVAFVAVHLAMVLLAGPVNQLRAMLTGWFVIRGETSR